MEKVASIYSPSSFNHIPGELNNVFLSFIQDFLQFITHHTVHN